VIFIRPSRQHRTSYNAPNEYNILNLRVPVIKERALQTEATSQSETRDESALRDDFKALLSLDAGLLADPYPLHRRLREQAPILRLDDSTVIVSSFALGSTVYRESTRFRGIEDRVMGFGGRLALLTEEDLELYRDFFTYERGWLTKINGERHRRVRTAAMRGFGRALLDEVHDSVVRRVDELLDDLAAQEEPDFMTFAERLPVLVIMDVMGAPDDNAGQVKDWCNAIAKIGGHSGPLTSEIVRAAHQGMVSYYEYVLRLLAEQRTRSDLPRTASTLLDASETDHLDEEELAALYILLMFAGHETTTSMLSNGILHLLGHRRQWEILCEDPAEHVPGAIEEILRYDAPVPFFAKETVETEELGGIELAPLTVVFIDNAAANRDPAVFENPDVFDITREPRPSLAFGLGVHFCLGAPLARLEGKVAFERLAERFPDMELAANVETLEYRPNYLLRGVTKLPVRLGRDHG
jgi:cytochrome P450